MQSPDRGRAVGASEFVSDDPRRVRSPVTVPRGGRRRQPRAPRSHARTDPTEISADDRVGVSLTTATSHAAAPAYV